MDDILASYDRAWNEPDDDSRRKYLATALTEDCELVEPRGRFTGLEAINARLAGFAERFPGARVEVTTGVDEHNGVARYGWIIRAADGTTMLDGIDVVDRAEDGRLRRIVMFFGALSQDQV